MQHIVRQLQTSKFKSQKSYRVFEISIRRFLSQFGIAFDVHKRNEKLEDAIDERLKDYVGKNGAEYRNGIRGQAKLVRAIVGSFGEANCVKRLRTQSVESKSKRLNLFDFALFQFWPRWWR